MARKLTSRQQATLAVLETFPPKFDHIHRAIEEMGSLKMDEASVRRLARMLDEMKAGAASIGEGALAETLGIMGTMARRGGGLQMKVRGLRESFGALRINFDGALQAAMRESPGEDEEEEEAKEPTTPSP